MNRPGATRVATPGATPGATDNIALAVATICFAVFALSLGDALIKRVSAQFGLSQLFVLRSLLAAPILIAAMRLGFPDARLAPKALGWTTVRSLMLTLMWVLYYLSLPQLDLSTAAATYYAAPLFITLFSALLIGERVRPLGWFAVVLGFLGVLLILRPQAGDFNAYALAPLGSAVLYALAMILTRTRCRGEHPLTLSLALNVSFITVGCALAGIGALLELSVGAGSEGWRGALLSPWTGVDADGWVVIAILAAGILIGSVGAAIAYQLAPPPVVATFDFAYIGFAVIWGVVFFAEAPDAIAIVGMLLIVLGGALALRR